MKKICLLFSIILCCLSGFAQTLQSAVTVVSGGDAILTVSGESASGYISNIIYKSQTVTPATANVLVSTPEYGGPPYPMAPTKFKITVTGYFNNLTTPITAKVIFRTLIWNQNGNANVEVDQTVTFTVTPPAGPVTIYNDAKSQIFYKNNCGAGFASDPYTYSVPSGKYSASTKAEANTKAQAEINANGQNTANANLTCKPLFYNTAITGVFRKNDCVAVQGTEVSTTIEANRFFALTQAEADAKAQAALNIEGQAKANAQGICPTYIAGPDIILRTNWDSFSLTNFTVEPGTTIVWSVDRARIRAGQGTHTVTIEFNYPGTIGITAKITRSSGEIILVTKDVNVRDCSDCPQS